MTDMEHIVRHTISDPADIEFVPTEHGEMTPAEWQDHILATSSPLDWDCFSFGVIQYADHFTFYVMCGSSPHRPDACWVSYSWRSISCTAPWWEAERPSRCRTCGQLRRLLRPAARQFTSALTLNSPQVRTWVEFAENNDGTLPDFPLPLGDPSVPSGGDLMVEQLMDEQQTAPIRIRLHSGGGPIQRWRVRLRCPGANMS